MQRFQNIRRIAFTSPFLYPDDEEAHDDCVLDDELLSAVDRPHLTSLLSSMHFDALKSLSIDGQCVSGMPIRILGNLTELNICVTTDDEHQGLDLVFRHAVQLESLSIVGFIGSELFPSLVTDSDLTILPLLRSFRLSCDNTTMANTPEPHWMDVLFSFLGDRSKLTRLYLRIPSLDLMSTHEALHLDLLGKLKDLRVFGLHTGATSLDMAFLRDLCGSLPKDLCAIHLAMDWGSNEPLLELVSLHTPHTPTHSRILTNAHNA